MKHARSDYDRIQDPEGKIPEDEPVFLIRAQDHIGWAVVAYWAQLAKRNGYPPEMVRAALHQAQLMADWPKHKKADMPQEPRP